MLWRHFRSHPVAMLLPVMRNGTFSTTTIVRKKCGKNPGMSRTYIRDWRHFRSLHVLWRHFRSRMHNGPIPPGEWRFPWNVAWTVLIYYLPTTMLSHSDRRTRGAHKFRQIHSNRDFHKFSFFPNTISIWNSLPQSICILSNLESFKSGISTLTFEGFPTHL